METHFFLIGDIFNTAASIYGGQRRRHHCQCHTAVEVTCCCGSRIGGQFSAVSAVSAETAVRSRSCGRSSEFWCRPPPPPMVVSTAPFVSDRNFGVSLAPSPCRGGVCECIYHKDRPCVPSCPFKLKAGSMPVSKGLRVSACVRSLSHWDFSGEKIDSGKEGKNHRHLRL